MATLFGLSVSAQPGSGVRVGEQTVLIPSASVSISHNDNVNLRRRAVSEGGERLSDSDSDVFLNTELALSLTHFGDSTQLSGRTWFGQRRYDENDQLDRDTFGISTGLFWTSPNADTTAKVDLSYQRAVDRTESSQSIVGDTDRSEELENVAERVERDEVRANFVISQQLAQRLRGDAFYNVADFDYKNERFNDRTSHLVGAELAYRHSEKTTPYLRLQLGMDDDEGFDGTAERPAYLVGVRYRPTDKLNLNLAVGYESYTRTPLVREPNPAAQRFDFVPGEEEKDSGMKFTANLNYAATPKTSFILSGRSGFGSVASSGSNSREELALSAAVVHQTTRQLTQRVSVAWREDDYLSPLNINGDEIDEIKETIWFQYRVDYQTVRPWLSLYANASFEDGSSQIPGDSYTETQFTLGARARY